MGAGDVEGHRELLTLTQRMIAEREPFATNMAVKAEAAEAAKARLARVENGEDVAGITAPMTRKDLLRISGMTEAEARHCVRVAGIAAAGDDWWRLMIEEEHRRKAKVETAVVEATAPHGDR